MNPPPKLLDQIRKKIRYKHYSIRTEDTYSDWIKCFILFHNKCHPDPYLTPLLLCDFWVQLHYWNYHNLNPISVFLFFLNAFFHYLFLFTTKRVWFWQILSKLLE